MVYFGDSIRSDVRPSKKFANWDTVMILEEMEAETHGTPETDDDCDLPKTKRKRTNTKVASVGV